MTWYSIRMETKGKIPVTLMEFFIRAFEPVGTPRRGQSFMNVLGEVRKDLYVKMTIDHPDIDPFYDDSRIWSAAEWVKANWGT